MKQPDAGTSAVYRVTPRTRDLASSIGNRGIDVVSTPALIGFLEQASHEAIKACFGAGEASVGVAVDVRHVAAARLGEVLECRATVTGVDRRKCTFAVEARQGATVVMRGSHQRVVVDTNRFGEQAPDVTARGDGLTFYFDVHSPWCYLASLRIGDLARAHGLQLDWRPLHLPSLLAATGDRGPAEASKSFLRWFRQDLRDWAALQDVEIRYHPRFPLRNSRALRCCAWAIEQGCGEAFVQRVLRGYWSEQADIEQPAVLCQFARDVSLDDGDIEQVMHARRYKQAVADNTDAALEAGVFGVPTSIVGRRLFFGNDRLDMLDRHLGEHRRATA